MGFTDYNLSDLYLKISSWFIGHKQFFKKWWVIVIISLDILMIVYIAVSFLLYALETPRYNRMISQMSVNFVDLGLRQKNQPESLTIELTKAILSASNRFDLVAKVKNPNNNWGIKSFQYKFILDGEETEESTGFILPGEEKYFLALNISHSSNQSPKKVEFVLSEIEWQKVTDTELLEKIKFTVEEEKITLGEVSSGTGATTLTAKVINSSIYDFWQVEVLIVIKSLDEPIALSRYTIREFKSYETREITASWLKALPLSANLEIIPEVNILETSNFMSL